VDITLKEMKVKWLIHSIAMLDRDSSDKVTLTIVRHGQTDANIPPRWLQGHSNNPLNDLGKFQASLLGERLKDEKFDAIFCSDLLRTKQTCEAIACNHPNTPIYYCPGLRELNMGELQFQLVTDVEKAARAAGVSFQRYIVNNGGESSQDLSRRLIAWWEETHNQIFSPLDDSALLRNVLVVAHGGSMRALLMHLVHGIGFRIACQSDSRGQGGRGWRGRRGRGGGGEERWDLSNHANTGLTKVVIWRQRGNSASRRRVNGQIVLLNDTSHLAANDTPLSNPDAAPSSTDNAGHV